MLHIVLHKIVFWCTVFNLGCILSFMLYYFFVIRKDHLKVDALVVMEVDKQFKEFMYPSKAHLVWLIKTELTTDKEVSMLVGCFRNRDDAEKFAVGNSHIQEIEIV